MKKGIFIGLIIFIMMLVLGGVIFLAINNTSNLAVADKNAEYVQAPTFFYYECSPASEPVESEKVNMANGNSGGFITAPKSTDTWDLWISQTETTKWYSQDRRIVYQICHKSGCDNQVYLTSNYWKPQDGLPSVHLPNLLTTDEVYVNYQSSSFFGKWSDEPNGAEWYQTYKPFVLWKVDMFGGGRTEYTTKSQGCDFLSKDKPNLINSVTSSKKQFNDQSSSSNTRLDFYKTRNFIGTFVSLSTRNINFVDYNGKDGYCLDNQIFSITEVKTNDETYKIVDSNFNTLLSPSVECCPGDKEPTRFCEDLKWKNIVINDDSTSNLECSLFNPCAGSDWMPSSFNAKQLLRYDCLDNKCVADTMTVECTSNSDCEASESCDTKIYECIKTSTGDVINRDPEVSSCSFYETEKTASVSLFGGIKPAGCVISSWVWLAGVAVILFIFLLLVISRFVKR